MLESGRLPDRTTVMDVTVGGGEIDAAVRADPVWSPDLRIDGDGDTVSYDWNLDRPPYSQDMMRSSPMRPLGVGGQMSVTTAGDGVHVLRTLDPEVMQAVDSGTGGSALTAGPYAPALQLLPAGRLVQLYGSSGFQMPHADGPTDIAVDPYLAVVVAVSVDADGLRTDSYFVYADDATARANLDAITESARNGQPGDAAAGEPGSAGDPDAVIEVADAAVHVTTRGFRSGPPVLIRE
jgi:hypothetical protein